MTPPHTDHVFFLVTGPMAAGRSTVAGLPAQRFERAVLPLYDVRRRLG